MKFIIALAVLLVGANANILRSPTRNEYASSISAIQSFSDLSLSAKELGKQIAQHRDDARLIEAIITEIIQRIADQIVAAGLDPLEVDRLELEYRLPVTDLLIVTGEVENLVLAGVSNIAINNINYGILSSRLTFDISLPRISAVIGASSLDVTFFGASLTSSLSGSIAIVEPRVQGDVRINISIIGGISVRSLSIDFTLRDIESDLNLAIQGVDYSAPLNNLLGNVIPTAIAENRSEINELIEYIVWVIIDAIL